MSDYWLLAAEIFVGFGIIAALMVSLRRRSDASMTASFDKLDLSNEEMLAELKKIESKLKQAVAQQKQTIEVSDDIIKVGDHSLRGVTKFSVRQVGKRSERSASDAS